MARTTKQPVRSSVRIIHCKQRVSSLRSSHFDAFMSLRDIQDERYPLPVMTRQETGHTATPHSRLALDTVLSPTSLRALPSFCTIPNRPAAQASPNRARASSSPPGNHPAKPICTSSCTSRMSREGSLFPEPQGSSWIMSSNVGRAGVSTGCHTPDGGIVRSICGHPFAQDCNKTDVDILDHLKQALY